MQNKIYIFNRNRYIVLPTDGENTVDAQLMPGAEDSVLHITTENGQPMVNGAPLAMEQPKTVGGLVVLLAGDCAQEYRLSGKPEIRFGSHPSCDVLLPEEKSTAAVLKGDTLDLFTDQAYLNGNRVQAGSYPLQRGDTLLILPLGRFVFSGETLACDGSGFTCTLPPAIHTKQKNAEFPMYKRSPRIIKRVPDDKVEVLAPPDKEQKQRGRLAKMVIPPLVMLCLTIAVSILSKRGLYVIVSAAGMAVSVVFSVTTFFGDRKDRKIREKERVENYEGYLLRLRKRLFHLSEQNREALRYHNPDVREIARLVGEYSERIYERAATDSDFLTVSLGTADVEPGYNLSYRNDELKGTKDFLRQEAEEVLAQFRTLPDMPVTVDLKNAHLGLVGEKHNIHIQLQALIAQLCFLQSYHDIEVITLVEEADAPVFEWIKWYPHCKVRSINISGLVFSENQRDQVLGNIAQVLKMRRKQTEEQKKDSLYLPHYVFVVDNPKLILNHSIMEYLLDEKSTLGFSLIYTTNIRANLPENIKTILMVDGKSHGTLLMNEGNLVQQQIRTHSLDGINLELMSRRLNPLQHNKGVTTQIPESITFFDMYGVKKPEQLPIERLWEQNTSYKSLAVPLGVRAKDDYVYLNLHEKAHGPHGLVAGTTGSGKSELLQSYILSLAVSFHPYEVGFLLIDYKGGGMANLFQNLPHLLGTITNLDGSESMRALASIKSELARRQRIFNDADVNNISAYTKLFKAGDVTLPLPHLFLISDEFAELKKEQPDFMSELVSAARIGRSLGVHLILATQKPSGVVDDQIWSNSKFKLALKVQDESDSNEVLKTPDAARITQPGRAYLQVGNNEVYELFQSAWSGADYSEKVVKQGFDGRIYLLNAIGQGELLNQDLSALDDQDTVKASQLDVTVERIHNYYESLHLSPVDRPWLPPLESRIVCPQLAEDLSTRDVGKIEGYHLDVSIGMIDIPEEQKQVEYIHDFTKDGNFAIFGASGFGKSTTEMEMALALAAQNSPERLNFYVLDLGNASLVQLRGLPHTADYLSFDDADKLKKMVKRLTGELRERKRLFASLNALNFEMYNTVAETPIPAIILFVDNYDVVKELGMDLEEFFTKLTRDGVGVGIYTVITASRSNAVRYAVFNNFKNKIAQFMFDNTETINIVGRSQYKLPEVRGRALVKQKNVSVMQCFLPAPFESDVKYANHVGNIVRLLRENNSAKEAESIRVLPEVLTYRNLLQMSKPVERQIPIALDTENVQVQYLDLTMPLQLIIGSPQTGKTNLLHLVLRQTTAKTVFVSDSAGLDLQDYDGRDGIVYMGGAAQAENFVKSLLTLVQERQQNFEQNGSGARPKVFYTALPETLIIIDDADRLLENCKGQEKDLETALMTAQATGVTIICTSLPGKMRGYDNVTKLLKDTQYGVLLGNPGDQTMLMLQPPRGYKQQVDMGFLYRRGEGIQIMLPNAAPQEGETK